MTELHETEDVQRFKDPFAEVRAESLRDDIFKLYCQPTYFPELESNRACVLVGGRGTGKTTTLKCLTYEGRYSLEGSERDNIQKWDYYGFYYKVNTNRVTAFQGDELTPNVWRKLFAHYLNLILCGKIVDFIDWYQRHTGQPVNIDNSEYSDLAEVLFLDEVKNLTELKDAFRRGRRRFESYLNNIDPDNIPNCSLQAQPLDDFCSSLKSLSEFKDKSFYFVLDEMENLLDYQQVVLNTIIKHCGADYTFKVGVRELGWRRRSTLNENEQLISPADYQRIDIEKVLDKDIFPEFARKICNARARSSEQCPITFDVKEQFPSLSIDEEAEKLGTETKAQSVLKFLKTNNSEYYEHVLSLKPLEIVFIDYWSRSKGIDIEDVVKDSLVAPKVWRDRYNNYKVSVLFTLKRGKSGIRKYYAGWQTLASMSHGNIRYMLQLVSQSRQYQHQNGKDVWAPIDARTQTKAAEESGRKNLQELEGLSVHGAKLMKLLLGLGRVFHLFAMSPEGHAPEVTQFGISNNLLDDNSSDILIAAVKHNAIVRSTATKLSDSDLKSYDYAIHPIFSSFFLFSHRRKRKFILDAEFIPLLIQSPKSAVRKILKQSDRVVSEDKLPDQLQLFEGFYSEDG